MIRNSVFASSVAASDPMRLDPNTVPPKILAQMIFDGAVATVTVQYTPDKPDMRETTDNYVNSRWFDVAQLTDQTADVSALIDTPVEAVRLNVTAYTSGTIELKAVQGYRVG